MGEQQSCLQDCDQPFRPVRAKSDGLHFGPMQLVEIPHRADKPDGCLAPVHDSDAGLVVQTLLSF
jgi:hypothetical protein